MYEDAVRKYGLVILLSALFFQMVFAEGGIFGYIKLKREIASINTSVATIEKENKLLSEEIKRLQTDDKYLEDVVRQKYGFLREGEKLYRIEK
jgi:cell division protein FtsB